jgi:acetyltransferase-like isoleucine patch superfamily enzyme
VVKLPSPVLVSAGCLNPCNKPAIIGDNCFIRHGAVVD